MSLLNPATLMKKASGFRRNKSDNTDGSASRDSDKAQDVPTNITPTKVVPQVVPQVVPHKILTFRKISTMLSFIQHNETYEITGVRYRTLKTGDPQRLQIKLCSAISSVAVIDAEVVATVAIPTTHALEVIVSSKFTENKPSHLQQAPSKDDEPKKSIWEALFDMFFVVAKNPERNDLEPPPKITLVSTPTLFTALEEMSDQQLIGYIEQSWLSPSLARHLYILPRLLAMPTEANSVPEMNHITRIYCYVAGACHAKMLRRFRNKTVSKPYLASLKAITVFKFKDDIDVPETTEGTQCEKEFLKSFVARSKGRLGIKIPLLEEQSALALGDKPFELYTKETAKEFHSVFTNIIEALENSLAIMKTEQDKGSDGKPVSDDYKGARLAAALNGMALMALSGSNALRKHLMTIQPLLLNQLKTAQQASPPQETEEEERERAQNKEAADEFNAVKPHILKNNQQVTLSESYLDWVKLLVVHFNAIKTLLAYVNGRKHAKGVPFKVKLLAVPPIVDNTTYLFKDNVPQSTPHMLPWRGLFEEDNILPKSKHAELYDFLEETVGTAEIISRMGKLWKARRLPYANKKRKDDRPDSTANAYQYIFDNLKDNKLKIDQLPGRDERAEIVQKLVNLAEDVIKRQAFNDDGIAQAVTSLLQELQSDMYFFLSLATPVFKGTLHCEAILASLMTKKEFDDPILNEIRTEMQGFQPNFGVSKYCCPVCAKLLMLLDATSIVKGSHNTVSGCSLPIWLSPDIVQKMNEYFGGLLKDALLRIMNDPDAGRDLTKSTGSRRLSQDSADGSGDYLPTFTDDQYSTAISIGRPVIIT